MDSLAAQRVGTTLEALFLATALRPLAAEFDALGGYGIDALAQSIAERDANGFGATLAASLAGRD